MKSVVHAACPHDCPDACGPDHHTDGRATKFKRSGASVTRGFLCAKVAKYLDRVYSPERVLYPCGASLAHEGSAWRGRHSPRKPCRDAFTDHVDEALTRSLRASGASSRIRPRGHLPYSYGGTWRVNGASMDRRFFHRLGASQLDRTICSSAGEEGLKSVIGIKLGTEPEQFGIRATSSLGANIHGNNVHLWAFIEEARREGAKLVSSILIARERQNAPTGICPSIPARMPRSRLA